MFLIIRGTTTTVVVLGFDWRGTQVKSIFMNFLYITCATVSYPLFLDTNAVEPPSNFFGSRIRCVGSKPNFSNFLLDPNQRVGSSWISNSTRRPNYSTRLSGRNLIRMFGFDSTAGEHFEILSFVDDGFKTAELKPNRRISLSMSIERHRKGKKEDMIYKSKIIYPKVLLRIDYSLKRKMRAN